MKILVINNHDSFVFNLVQLLRESEFLPETDVVSYDDIPDISGYDGIVMSPGPGTPSMYRKLSEILDTCGDTPILGVCLGFQAITEHFGGALSRILSPLHGHRSTLAIEDTADPLLKDLPQPSYIGRYHSWKADKDRFPDCLTVTSTDEDGNIMSLKHKSRPVWGVQFHPESYISNCGRNIMDNWLKEVFETTTN